MGSVHPHWVTYDLQRLIANLAAVRRRAGPDCAIFAAIKGNAYGHGAWPVARSLERAGVAGFMTGSFEEACDLCARGLQTPIVLFAGALPQAMAEVVAAGLFPTVVDRAGLEAAAAAGSAAAPAKVYLKVDMGLGRLGVPPDQVVNCLTSAVVCTTLEVIGLYTHLPFADQAGRAWARARFAAFDALLADLRGRGLLPPVTQAGASSSVLAGFEDQASAVCVGHLLYGLSPFADGSLEALAVTPVIAEIGTRLVQVARHPQGSDLAIANRFQLRAPKRIGVAPIGAANGLQRPVAGSRPVALVRGRRVPILAVSLEHLTLDLDPVDDAQAGDPVLLLGRDGDEEIGLDALAAWSGLTPLDLVLALSGRLAAQHRDGPGAREAP